MLDFILGLITGGTVGFLICAMLVIANDKEEYEDEEDEY